MNTFEELNAIFCKTFYEDDIVLTREHTVNDIEGWDSLSHTSLVFAVEKHFGIKFDNQEIPKWKNVGEMYDRLVELLQKK